MKYLLLCLSFGICLSVYTMTKDQTPPSNGLVKKQLIKTDAEWEKILDSASFQVLRKHATERPFSGTYLSNKAQGTYYCRACSHPLFASSTKFKSGTGWPSFWKVISDSSVIETPEGSAIYSYSEVSCAKCEGHLGHVFQDGPKPTGLRYCMNSVALFFLKK